MSVTVGTSRFMLVMAIFTPFAGVECQSSVQSSTAGQARSGVEREWGPELVSPDRWSQKERENAVIHSLSVQIAGLRECSRP